VLRKARSVQDSVFYERCPAYCDRQVTYVQVEQRKPGGKGTKSTIRLLGEGEVKELAHHEAIRTRPMQQRFELTRPIVPSLIVLQSNTAMTAVARM